MPTLYMVQVSFVNRLIPIVAIVRRYRQLRILKSQLALNRQNNTRKKKYLTLKMVITLRSPLA